MDGSRQTGQRSWRDRELLSQQIRCSTHRDEVSLVAGEDDGLLTMQIPHRHAQSQQAILLVKTFIFSRWVKDGEDCVYWASMRGGGQRQAESRSKKECWKALHCKHCSEERSDREWLELEVRCTEQLITG